MALRPRDSTAATVSASLSSRRAPSATSAPASASALAKVTPRPLDAPVTTATLPSRRNESRKPISLSLEQFGHADRTHGRQRLFRLESEHQQVLQLATAVPE